MATNRFSKNYYARALYDPAKWIPYVAIFTFMFVFSYQFSFFWLSVTSLNVDLVNNISTHFDNLANYEKLFSRINILESENAYLRSLNNNQDYNINYNASVVGCNGYKCLALTYADNYSIGSYVVSFGYVVGIVEEVDGKYFWFKTIDGFNGEVFKIKLVNILGEAIWQEGSLVAYNLDTEFDTEYTGEFVYLVDSVKGLEKYPFAKVEREISSGNIIGARYLLSYPWNKDSFSEVIVLNK